MSSSNSNKQNEIKSSLKLTNVKSEQKQASKNKQITLNKFLIKPNNNEYFIGIIRIICADEFRLTMLNNNNCWISKQETFNKHYNNNNNSSQNMDQYRNYLLSALTKPNDSHYEIHEKDQMNKDKKNTSKQLTIYRKGFGIKIILAKFKLFPGKKNLFYVFDKLEITLNEKKKESDKYYINNKKLQTKYNKLMNNLEESINQKNKQEHELLNKFVLVLNEKKQKIKSLQNEIFALKSNGNMDDNMDINDEQVNDYELELKYDINDDVEWNRNINYKQDNDIMELSMAVNDSCFENNNNVIDDGSLDIAGFEYNNNVNISGKRNRNIDIVEIVDLKDKPKKKRRKSDMSDSSYEFNTDSII